MEIFYASGFQLEACLNTFSQNFAFHTLLVVGRIGDLRLFG
jgi:hypothetical protein